jgi:hypothetical protein
MQDKKIQQISDRIKNRTYLINTEQHKINDVAINGTAVYISTDKRMFIKRMDDFPAFVKTFLPVDTAVTVSRKDMDTKSIQDVRKLLLSNLEKVTKDESYIKQVNAANSTVNTLMNTFKTEITLRKALGE